MLRNVARCGAVLRGRGRVHRGDAEGAERRAGGFVGGAWRWARHGRGRLGGYRLAAEGIRGVLNGAAAGDGPGGDGEGCAEEGRNEVDPEGGEVAGDEGGGEGAGGVHGGAADGSGEEGFEADDATDGDAGHD